MMEPKEQAATEASTSSLLAVPGSASTTQRKLLKADHINPLLLNFSQDDEEDDLEEIPPGSPPRLPGAFVPDQFTLCSSSSDLSTPLNPNTHNFRLRNSKTIQREISPRRHSITALPNALSRTLSAPFPKSRSHNSHLSSFAQPSDPRIRLHPSQLSGEPGSLPCSGPSSSASSVSSASLPSPPGSPMMHNHLQDDFVRSEQFQQEVQGKLITLEELVRMRRVLTAASLENLPLDSSVKDDVACGKVCFVCRKTRFSVFNTKTWWHNCKLCRRTVCIKCCSKMRIPSDRFENVAVTELSHAVASSSTLTDKKKSDEPEEPPPKTPLSATTSSSSLLSHLAHLKLPQFRISTPGGGTESSTPSSPVTGRRKQALAAQQSYSASGQHQPLSRHLSLSANATPVRNRLSAQASIACPNTQQQSRKAPACESHVCRDCQTLIERIVYHPVHTLHPVDHAHHHHHHQQQQQPVHVSLP